MPDVLYLCFIYLAFPDLCCNSIPYLNLAIFFPYLSWSRVTIGGQDLINLVILLFGRFLMISLASLTIFLIALIGVGLF